MDSGLRGGLIGASFRAPPEIPPMNVDGTDMRHCSRPFKALQGNGVFARTAFREGDYIGHFDGVRITDRTQMSLQFGAGFHVEPAADCPFRNLNHCCDANAYFTGRSLHARCDIEPGEEITIDYNCHELELFAPFLCGCGVAGCLGQIRGYRYLSNDQKEQRADRIGSWLRDEDEATL